MGSSVKVVIAGVNGRMGRASLEAILSASEFQLVGAYGRAGAEYVGKPVRELVGVATSSSTDILVSNDFSEAIKRDKPDVLLEFTRAESSVVNARLALENGIRPVLGTSGIPQEAVHELSALTSKVNLGALIVPNFSVGAVLMMEFAKQAAAQFENSEIIEIHHTKKVDAPSGTAMHTLDKMSAVNSGFNKSTVQEKELIPGARGGKVESGLRVHSLRLPGLLSHQEVIFGAEGELLTIKHDSFNTKCFAKGILLSMKSVLSVNGLVVGLESFLITDAAPARN